MNKTLLEILKKYQPDEETAAILLSADPDSVRVRADREQRALEIRAFFPQYIEKKILYTIIL